MDLWTHATLWRFHLQWASISIKGWFFLVWTYATLNARKSGHTPFSPHDSLIMNARNFFRAFMIRLSCVQNGLFPDCRAFKVTCDQAIVRSKLHMSRLSCVQNCICPDYRAFRIAYVQTIVRSFFFQTV